MQKIAQGNGQWPVKGPGVDQLVQTVHMMLGRGAPVKYDFTGFNKPHYTFVMNNENAFMGYNPQQGLPVWLVVRTLQVLAIYQARQLPNYMTLKQSVVDDINNSRPQGSPELSANPEGKVVKFMQKGDYGKNVWLVPGLGRTKPLTDAIEIAMREKMRSGDMKWSPEQMFKVITKSRSCPDCLDIHPVFTQAVVAPLKQLGYDTTAMEQFQTATPAAGSRQRVLVAKAMPDGQVVINFGAAPTPEVLAAIKPTFRYTGRETNDWVARYPDAQRLTTIKDIVSKAGWNTEQLDQVIAGLSDAPSQPQAPQAPGNQPQTPQAEFDYQLRIRDITGETNGQWHIAVGFLKKGTWEGEMLKKIIKFSFIAWGQNMDDPNAARVINKKEIIDRQTGRPIMIPVEYFIRGRYIEYLNFYTSLKRRGYDVSRLQAIVKSLIQKGLVKRERAPGEIDGFGNDQSAARQKFLGEIDKYDLYNVDSDGNKKPFKLFPEQKEEILTMYTHNARLKGDETGAGKTVQSILAADMRLNTSGGRCVIITKWAAKDQWLDALTRFLKLDTTDDNKLVNENPFAKAKWTVLHYNEFGSPGTRQQLTEELVRQSQAHEITCLILDECHSVKNGNPKVRQNQRGGKGVPGNYAGHNTTFNVQDFAQFIPFVWGLSATVVANKPIDVYNQLKVINHPLGKMPWNRFAVEFGGMVKGSRGLQDGTVEQRLEAVNSLKEFMIDQRCYSALSKEQLRKDMPKQIVTQHGIDVDTGQLFANVRKRLATYKNPGLPVSNMIAFRTEVAVEKAPYTVRMARPALEQGKRVLIFTDFDQSKEMLKSELQRALDEVAAKNGTPRKSVIEISGGQTKKTRRANIAAFKNLKSDVGAAVINIAAGGTGLDFPNTTDNVWVNDFDWSVANDEQALGRTYRINSERDNHVGYVVANGTPDGQYYERMDIKKQVASVIHRMSMEQDALMMGGARRGKSKELDKVETQLNAAKKRYIEMEEEEGYVLGNIMSQIQRATEAAADEGDELTARSKNWYKTAKKS